MDNGFKQRAEETIRRNLERVRMNIQRAAKESGRDPDSVRLVVVTKSQPVEVVAAAIAAGATCLGENYPEEAAEKIAALKLAILPELHMIGHLQSRKAKFVVDYFQMMHSLDSLRIADRLEHLLGQADKTLPVLLEFNVGGEPAKYGWNATKDDCWEEMLPEIEKILSLPHLSVRGLMTMPPLFSDAEKTRPYFVLLRRLRDYLAMCFPNVHWDALSMGTSGDYETAIREGATLVRIGKAVLGARPTKI